ncbi:Rrf2 family transcriptional regulator [Marinilongibacter aquaticus]|uniref:RrF2 family transcriptional regulator n=1 Tax=Marinilongibacter aquaticus TaxID=2975157 RepID=UPI0021BDCDA8|nr:Rrf2 family transcriptional regulator [Marinilongibacter aquaticus]UBM59015.1 Rrf2 family transcriptional regulator [Marinilongibacter aquaticus]
MISKKAKYALKALKYLGAKYEDACPTLISEIAEAENIPKKFLEAILLELRNNSLLRSQKGKGGGYFLRIPPSEITFAKVLRIIDGPIAPLLCVSLNFYGQCEDCRTEEECTLRPIMGQVRDANLEIYEKMTVADLIH